MADYFGQLAQDKDAFIKKLDPFIKTIVVAQNSGDFELFKSLFADKMHGDVSQEAFQFGQTEIQKNMGTIISCEYLGSLKKESHPMALYRARFDKSEDDALLSVILDDTKPEPRALGIWIN